jgi:hypothetical protein
MRSRALLRAFFTLVAIAAAWFVVTPASAAGNVSSALVEASFAPAPPPAPPPPSVPPSMRAPLCDPRGAITFAPPPQMQDVEVSLDTGLALDDCMSTSSGDSRHAAPGRAPLPIDGASASLDSALARALGAAILAHAARELVPAPIASTSCSRPGYRSTVDRPPRV